MSRESRPSSAPTDNSPQGVYSFVCGLLVLAFGLLFVALVFVLPYTTSTASQALDAAYTVGRFAAYVLIAALVGFVLGVIGVCRTEFRKTLAVWGLAMNGLFLFAVLGLALVVSLGAY